MFYYGRGHTNAKFSVCDLSCILQEFSPKFKKSFKHQLELSNLSLRRRLVINDTHLNFCPSNNDKIETWSEDRIRNMF